MTWTIIAVLIVVGFLFLLLEILVLPGTNIAGIIGFVLIAIGVWQAYAQYGGRAGTITLVGTVLLSVLSLVLALKAGTWKRASLKSEIVSRVNVVESGKINLGDTGVAISKLGPMGKAYIGGEYFEVRTDGEYIDQGSEIIVTKVENNKITVKRKST